MKKIPTLFQRNYDTDRLVRNEVVPGCGWVIEGEGVATRKWDGTCCMVRGGNLYKRYELKPGTIPPDQFEPAQDPDEKTGKVPGWVPVGDGPEDQWHREAFREEIPDGIYELLGPKVQGNPEDLDIHVLVLLGALLLDVPRDFDGLKGIFELNDIEGIVWWHPDGRKAKIKGKDFGIKRSEVKRRIHA